MSTNSVEVPFLPSDVDRLILGYLSDAKYNSTYNALLQESPFLYEYSYLKQMGILCPTTTCEGLSLIDILSEFFSEKRRQKKIAKRSVAAANVKLSTAREQLQATSHSLQQTALLSSTAAVQISASHVRQCMQKQQQPQQQQQQHAILVLSDQQCLPTTSQNNAIEVGQALTTVAKTPVETQSNPAAASGSAIAASDQTVETAEQPELLTTADDADVRDAATAPESQLADNERQVEQRNNAGASAQAPQAMAEAESADASLDAATTTGTSAHKKKSRPRKAVPAALPASAPVQERRKLIDKILSSPDKFANSWEQAVTSKKLETDTEKLKQLLDSEQNKQRDLLADIFLTAFLDDDNILFDANLHNPEPSPARAAESAEATSAAATAFASDGGGCIGTESDGLAGKVEFELAPAELSHQPLNDSADSDEANVVCDPVHIESILSELTSPFQTPNKLQQFNSAASSSPAKPAASCTRSDAGEPAGRLTSARVTSQLDATVVVSMASGSLSAAACQVTTAESYALLQLPEQQQRRQLPQLSDCYIPTGSCDLDESCSLLDALINPASSSAQQPIGSAAATSITVAAKSGPASTPAGKTEPSTQPELPSPALSSTSTTCSWNTTAMATRSSRRRHRVDLPEAESPLLRSRTRRQKPPSSPSPPPASPPPTPPARRRAKTSSKTLSGFVCSVCGHSYSERNRLNRHMAVHQQIKALTNQSKHSSKNDSSNGALPTRSACPPANSLYKRVRSDLKAMDINSFINSLSFK